MRVILKPFSSRALALLLAAALIISLCPALISYAGPTEAETDKGQANYFDYNNISPERNITKYPVEEITGVAVKGFKPYVFGLPDHDTQVWLNAGISEFYDAMAEGVTENTRQLEFSFETSVDGDIVTIIMYCARTALTTDRFVATRSFDRAASKPVTLGGLMGPNAAALINKLIIADARKRPTKYNANFSGISENQGFRTNENGSEVILIFSDNEISPKKPELFEFAVNPGGVVNLGVTKDEYFATKDFNVKMIMLRSVADAFGYELEWAPETQTVSVYKYEELISFFAANINSYAQPGAQRRKLEAAPEIVNGRTYLPISFYSEFFGLIYSIDADGTVWFSEYREK